MPVDGGITTSGDIAGGTGGGGATGAGGGWQLSSAIVGMKNRDATTAPVKAPIAQTAQES